MDSYRELLSLNDPEVSAALASEEVRQQQGIELIPSENYMYPEVLAAALLEEGLTLVTGGTDNHMMVIDTVASFGIDGKESEQTLDRIGVAVNKQVIPDDPRPPLRPSGVRIGTPACTTRGMVEEDMRRIGAWVAGALRHREDAAHLDRLAVGVREFSQAFPVPGLGRSQPPLTAC